MDRRLALAYLICTLAIALLILGVRVLAPNLSRETGAILGGVLAVAMFASAYLFFVGARRSIGALRKSLAYVLSAFTSVAGVSLALAVALALGGVANAA